MAATSTARAAVTFWGIATLFLVLVVVVRVAAQPLLLVFAALLFATSLRGLAEWIAAKLRWPVGYVLVALILGSVLLTVAAWVLIIPGLVEQGRELAATLRTSYESVRGRYGDTALGRQVFDGTAELTDP